MSAFRFQRCRQSAVPVLIAVPHAGRYYPPAIAERLRNPGLAALRLEDRLVDQLAEVVARATGADLLVCQAPRAMIDLNRAIDDMDWDMVQGGRRPHHAARPASRRARSGLGLVPRRLSGTGELWTGRMDAAELDARIERVHGPYHHVLQGALADIRARWGSAVLLDLHSMPPLGAVPGTGPAFVVGDRFGASCSGFVASAMLDFLAAHGKPVAHNRPYAGGYVLDRHGDPAGGTHAVQLEICRTLYLDGELREVAAGFAEAADLLAGLVRRVAAEIAVTGGSADKVAAE